MIEMTYSIYVQNFTMCEYLMVDIVPLPIDAIHVCVTVGSDPIAIRATPHKASIIDKENCVTSRIDIVKVSNWMRKQYILDLT